MSIEPMPLRGAILLQALEATTKARNVTYGDPSVNLQCAGELKAIYTKYAGDKYCEAHDEAIEMVLTKIGRIATGQPGHDDTYIDAAAYVAIASECQTKSAIAEQNERAAIEEFCDEAPYYTQTVGVIVEDPINRDTALPEPKTRGMNADLAAAETHGEIKAQSSHPVLAGLVYAKVDEGSPRKEFGYRAGVAKLGDWVNFRPGGNDYRIIHITDDEFPTFKVQHAYSGRTYTHIPAHIYELHA